MLQPIAQHISHRKTGVMEVGDILIIDGLKYDSDTLSPKGLVNIQKNPSNIMGFYDTVVNPGGQATHYNISNHAYSTLILNPNMFILGEAKSLIDLGDGYKFVGCQNQGHRGILYNEEGDIVYARVLDNNIYSISNIVPLGNNEFLMDYRRNSDGYIASLEKYDPTTKTIQNIHDYKLRISYDGTGYYLFKSSDNERYYYYTGYTNNTIRFTYYNKTSKSITHLTSKQYANKNCVPLPSQILEEDANADVKRMYVVSPTSNSAFVISLVSIDTANNKITYTQCTVDTTGIDFVFNINSRYVKIVPFIHKFNNKRYLSFYLATGISSVDRNSFRLYTFEISDNDPTALTYVTQFNFNSITKGYIALDNTLSKLVIPTEGDLVTMSFLGTEWQSINLGVGKISSATYDTKGRLWAVTDDGNIYMVVPQTPMNVVFTFEKDNYEFVGNPINTYVKVSTFNYLGDRISTSGTLKILTNNAEFMDGSNQTNITTGANGDTQVDFKITGPGLVRFVYDVNV